MKETIVAIFTRKPISEIKKMDSIFYTGHCTGDDNFSYLKEKLGNQIQPMNVGVVIGSD